MSRDMLTPHQEEAFAHFCEALDAANGSPITLGDFRRMLAAKGFVPPGSPGEHSSIPWMMLSRLVDKGVIVRLPPPPNKRLGVRYTLARDGGAPTIEAATQSDARSAVEVWQTIAQRAVMALAPFAHVAERRANADIADDAPVLIVSKDNLKMRDYRVALRTVNAAYDALKKLSSPPD